MSLGRRYYLQCESRDVVRRIGQEWLAVTLRMGCVLVSPTGDEARTTRKNAKKLGWTRPTVRFPIAVGTSTAQFDLCPRCSHTIAQTIGELPK